jgi:ABC-type nitrate/sulfonate/bicarbonate transport system permease component
MSRRAIPGLLELVVPIAVLVAWGVWSSSAHSFYFPPLTDILTTFKDTWLFERATSDALPSLERMFAGFAIAAVAGVAIGIPLGMQPALMRALTPLIEFLRAVPPPALIPFGIVVLGTNSAMKIFVIALVCFFPVLLNAVDGVRGVDSAYAETSRVYRIDRWRYVTSVLLPAALPQIVAGLRTALSLALILMVISEMVASTNGIGYFILQSQRSFALPEMWSGIVLLGLIGYVLNLMFVLVERRVLHWHRGARGRSDA